MKNLHQLYDDMIAQNVISTIFNIVYNKHIYFFTIIAIQNLMLNS